MYPGSREHIPVNKTNSEADSKTFPTRLLVKLSERQEKGINVEEYNNF